MEYNTSNEKIAIKEYGRNIQKMVNYLLTIEDREKRSKLSHTVVKVMSQVNPQEKDSQEYWHKLWDHLHIIAGFQLDIDAPYPKPSPDIITRKPDRVPYPKNKIKFRPYGINAERLVEKAIQFEEGPQKEAFISDIANLLKRQYVSWNRDSVDDEVIAQHLSELSNNELKLDDDFKFISTRDLVQQNTQQRTSNNRNTNRRHKNNRRNKNTQRNNPSRSRYQQPKKS